MEVHDRRQSQPPRHLEEYFAFQTFHKNKILRFINCLNYEMHIRLKTSDTRYCIYKNISNCRWTSMLSLLTDNTHPEITELQLSGDCLAQILCSLFLKIATKLFEEFIFNNNTYQPSFHTDSHLATDIL